MILNTPRALLLYKHVVPVILNGRHWGKTHLTKTHVCLKMKCFLVEETRKSFVVTTNQLSWNYSIFLNNKNNNFNRVFHKHNILAIMPILVSELYYGKTKKSSDKMLLQWGLNLGFWLTFDSKSSALLSELIWHVLLRRFLKVCFMYHLIFCIRWFSWNQ